MYDPRTGSQPQCLTSQGPQLDSCAWEILYSPCEYHAAQTMYTAGRSQGRILTVVNSTVALYEPMISMGS